VLHPRTLLISKRSLQIHVKTKVCLSKTIAFSILK
jgi:hypothetical protein